MYKFKNRLSARECNRLIPGVVIHSQSKPNRTTHYYELRSAFFKLLCGDNLHQVEQALVQEEMNDSGCYFMPLQDAVAKILRSHDVRDDFDDPDFANPDSD